MFLTKSNSKQKRAKKTQERKTGSLLLNIHCSVYLLCGENIRCGELGSTRQTSKTTRCGELGTTRQATKNTRCGELGTTRQATKNIRCASDDIYSLGEVEHSLWRATTDRSRTNLCSHSKTHILTTQTPKIDRKHYLRLFYNLDITLLH